MPRNASGTFSLAPSYNPVVSNDLITAVWANTTLTDMASAVTDSLDRYGRGGMLAPFRLSDGTVALPGIAFSNETSSGFSRLGSGAVSGVVLGNEIWRMGVDGVDFYQLPRCTIEPSNGFHLTNKQYVDQLAFNTALPGVASQDIGAQIYVSPAGVAQWSQLPAEEQALSVLVFLGA